MIKHSDKIGKHHKLSKKYSVSEVLNPLKTKKYSNVRDNIKNKMKKYIIKKKPHKNTKKFKSQADNKLLHHNKNKHSNKQNIYNISSKVLQGGSGSSGSKDGRIIPDAAKLKFGTVSDIGFISGQKNTRTPNLFDSKKFNVFTKFQYKMLKRSVYNTIRSTYFLKFRNKITNVEYELIKRLLKTNMYFARLKLVQGNLFIYGNELFGAGAGGKKNKNSILRNLHILIRDIFNLQQTINFAYMDPNAYLKIKGKKIKNNNNYIKSLVKQQDKLRKKVMEYSVFKDNKDLGTCFAVKSRMKKALITVGEIAALGMLGTTSYRNSKEIICAIGKYRKYETKFNKYYQKFASQYALFIENYPECNNGIDTLKLENIDIDTIDDKYIKRDIFDKSKCFTSKLNKETDSVFSKAGKYLQQQLGTYSTNVNTKVKELSVSYLNKAKDFTTLVTEFNKGMKLFNDIFAKAEGYGIRRCHGLPIKKGIIGKLGMSSQNIFTKPKKLEELSKDPKFINDFTNMITKIANENKEIFEPGESKMNLSEDKIIPLVKLYREYYYIPTVPVAAAVPVAPAPVVAAAPLLFTIYDKVSLYSINLDGMDKNNYTKANFWDLYNSGIVGQDNIHFLPIIVCVQNGYRHMDNSKEPTEFENNFLANQYVCIAYSYSIDTQDNNQINVKTCNMIYVKKICIDETYIKIDDIVPFDQTSYFKLDGMTNKDKGITTEQFAKSFAAVSINISQLSTVRPDTQSYNEITYDTSRVMTQLKDKVGTKEELTKINNTKQSEDKIQELDASIDSLKTKMDRLDAVLNNFDTIIGRLPDGTPRDTQLLLLTDNDNLADPALFPKLGKDCDEVLLNFNSLKSDINNLKTGKTEEAEKLKSKLESNFIVGNVLDIFRNKYERTKLKYEILTTDIKIKKFTPVPPAVPPAVIPPVPPPAEIDLDGYVAPLILQNNFVIVNSLNKPALPATVPATVPLGKDLKNEFILYIYSSILHILRTCEVPPANIAKYIKTIAPAPVPVANANIDPDASAFADEIATILENNYDLTDETTYDNIQKWYDDNLHSGINLVDKFKKITVFNTKYNINNIFDETNYVDFLDPLDPTNFWNYINMFKYICINYLLYFLCINKFNSYDYNKTYKTAKNNYNNSKTGYDTAIINYKIPTTTIVNLKLYETNIKNHYKLLKTLYIYESYFALLLDYVQYYFTDNLYAIDYAKTNSQITPPIPLNLISIPSMQNKDVYEALGGSLQHNQIGGSLMGKLFGKSPAVIPTTQNYNAFVIVTISLVGSKLEDIKYAEVLNSYTTKTDGTTTNRHLRSVQIDQMVTKIKHVIGEENNPNVICGAFGSTIDYDNDLDDAKVTNYLLPLYYNYANIDSHSVTLDNDHLKELISSFYRLESDFIRTYEVPTFHYKNNDPVAFTTKKCQIKNNNIFIKTDMLTDPPVADPKLLKYNSLLNDQYGTDIPLEIIFNSDTTPLTIEYKVRNIRGKTFKNIELYSKLELENIIKMIDKLLSNFGFGYKAYLKRDLGCLSMGYGMNIEDINKMPETKGGRYSIRDKDIDISGMENFYTMNYPSFIDVFLYQISGNYNNSTANEFYSENQLSKTNLSNTDDKDILPIFKVDEFMSKKDKFDNRLFKDMLIRLLMIPSNDLESISGINYMMVKPDNYIKIAQMFCNNFYRNKIITKLEERLNVIMNTEKLNQASRQTNQIFVTDEYEKLDREMINKKLLYYLIQTTDVVITGKDSTGKVITYKQKQLTNIKNPELIMRLFEFIFIMLKLKYIYKQIETIDKLILLDESITGKTEKFALLSTKYFEDANTLFEIPNNININFTIAHDLVTKEVLPVSIYKKYFRVNESGFLVSIVGTEIEVPNKDIKTISDMENWKTYFSYMCIIAKLCNFTSLHLIKLRAIYDNVAPGINIVNTILSSTIPLITAEIAIPEISIILDLVKELNALNALLVISNNYLTNANNYVVALAPGVTPDINLFNAITEMNTLRNVVFSIRKVIDIAKTKNKVLTPILTTSFQNIINFLEGPDTVAPNNNMRRYAGDTSKLKSIMTTTSDDTNYIEDMTNLKLTPDELIIYNKIKSDTDDIKQKYLQLRNTAI